MLVHFWGVRGSLPTPILPAEVQAKVAAIVEQAVPDDFADAESKKRFLAGLPPWLHSTVGGNSPCVSVDIDDFNEPIIFDCGSGMREMKIGSEGKPLPERYHIFFSHFHWDHLYGFPFFGPAFNPAVTLDFYSPKPNMQEYLSGLMSQPYFPVQLETIRSTKHFHLLESPVSIGPLNVEFKKMSHPGDSSSYKITHNGKRFIYATDVELSNADFSPDAENINFFKDADCIVLDSQYTPDDAADKSNWGHSSFSTAVDFAAHWGIKRLFLFHYEPAYDDLKLYEILQSARSYLEEKHIKGLEVSLATEGLEIAL